MNPQKIVSIMLQGENAGHGDLYQMHDCPYTPGSRKAMVWTAGFAAARTEKIEARTDADAKR